MGVGVFAKSSQLFNKLWPQYLNELETALSEQDYEEYKSVAHKLKGAAGSVGLLKVQASAKEMENKALTSTDEQLKSWIDSLPAQIKEGLDALQVYLDKLTN